MKTIQIRISKNEDGEYEVRRCEHDNGWLFARIGYGSTIPEAIDDFLKINKLENKTFKWS